MANIHRSAPRVVMMVATVLLGAGAVAVPLALGADEGFLGKALLAVAAPAVLMLYLTLRAARIGVSAGDTGIVIRNFWRTTRWAWTDVAELVTGPAATAWQTASGQIALIAVAKRGRRVIATGTTTRLDRGERLELELAPVFAIAERNGVRCEFRRLTAEQLVQIRRKVEAINAITGIARRLQ